MKILFAEEGHGVGGSVISLYYLVRGLAARGVRPVVTFPAPHGWSERFRAVGADVVYLDGSTAPLPGGSGDPSGAASGAASATRAAARPADRAWTRWPLYQTLSFYKQHARNHEAAVARWRTRIERLAPDIVYGNNDLPLNFDLFTAAARLGVPVYGHLRGFQPLRAPHRAFRPRFAAGIAISDVVRRHYLDAGFAPEQIHRVYNGLDPSDYPFREPGADIPPHAGRILFLGRLTGWKGAPVLLDALARIRARRPGLALVIAGDGPARSDWEADAVRLGVRDQCDFRGFVADVPGLLHGADLLVHVSTEPEPFGRVLIEGMACGTPVVASRLGATPEIIEDGVHGALVAAGDPAALAARIEALLADGVLRANMARAARRRVEEQFSVDTMVAGVERVLIAHRERRAGVGP